MKKRIIVLFMAVMLAFPVMVSAAETTQEITILIDGFYLNTSVKPILKGSSTLVGINEIFKTLGAEVNWNAEEQSVTAVKGDMTARMVIGSNLAKINGETVEMPAAAQIIGGNIMVPIRFVSEAFSAKVTWDEQTMTVNIDTGVKSMSVMDARISSIQDPKAKVISFETAYTAACAESSSIKKVKDNQTSIETKIKETNESMGATKNLVSKSYVNLLRTMLSLQNQLENIPTQLQQAKDKVKSDLQAQLVKIRKSELSIIKAEDKLVLDEKELSNKELKYSLGLETKNNLENAKQSLTQSKNNLENTKQTLANQKAELNTMLGYSLKDNIIIEPETEDNLIFEILGGLDSFVKAKKSSAVSLVTYKQAVAEAEYALKTHDQFMTDSSLSGQESREDLVKTAEQKQKDLDQAILDLEKNMTNDYNSIKQLEKTRESLVYDLEKAYKDYDLALSNFKRGTAVFSTVENAKLSILNAEIGLYENVLSHYTAVFAFNQY